MNTSILDSLLSPGNKPEPTVHRNVNESIKYSDIKRVRVSGRLAVLLPSGQVLAKALDRKQGKPVWVPFGRKEVV